MNLVEKEIIETCKVFIQIANILYDNDQITYEQYVDMIKLKLDYINKIELKGNLSLR